MLAQSLEDNRLVPVNIVLGPKLTAIVVAPDEDTVQRIDDVDKAAAHLELRNLPILRVPLEARTVDASFEKRSEALDCADEAGNRLIVLNESVSTPRAQRPAPKKYLIVFIDQHILGMIRPEIPYITILQLFNGDVVRHIAESILNSALALEVQAARIN